MDFRASSKDHYNYQQLSNNLDGSWGHSANDEGATDNEQEDLPYDGILECYLAPSLDCDLEYNSDVPSNCLELTNGLEESLLVDISIQSSTTSDETVYSFDSKNEFSLSETISKPSEAKENTEHNNENLHFIPTIIPDVLLRHFNEDSLLNPYEFIDYETMPEVSIAESSDETVISRKSCTKHSQCYDFEEDGLDICQNENTGDPEDIINELNSDTDQSSPKEDVPENDGEAEELCELPTNNIDKEVQHPKQDQERRLSSSEIKYGQGQVHYKLPDFSKVPPKVKIPKGESSNVKPVSSTKRVPSSSNLLGQSFVIQDILDSMQPFTEHGLMNNSSICSDHLHVQVLHYDSNSKEQIANLVPPTTDFHQPLRSKRTEYLLTGMQQDNGLQTCKSEAEDDGQSQNTEDTQLLTEGEKMSRMLMEQVQELKNKVFQNLRSCLESLEINYLSSKEKHRGLQLQTYMTGCQNVGEFDLEREVEGQIYRLGMLLEDIQEQINKNAESLIEFPPSIKSHQASHAEEPGDASKVKNSLTEKDLPIQEEEPNNLSPCLWSLNSSAPKQEPPMEKHRTDHSHLTESVDATDMKKNTVTEMVVTSQEDELMDLLSCSMSLNSSALKIQIPEPPMLKNESDNSNLLQSTHSLLTSPRLGIAKASESSYKSMTNCSDQLAKRHTYATSMDNASPVQDLLTTSLFPQCSMSQRQSSTVLPCSEYSGHFGKKKTLERLKSGIKHNPLFQNRSDLQADLRKTHPVSPGNLSICIQGKALNLEIPVSNKRTDSFSSNWLVTSHSQISKYRNRLSRSSGNYQSKELYKQKSYEASKSRIPVISQNQVSLANKLDFSKSDKVTQYMPLSRYSLQSSRQSQLAASVTSSLQRSSWAGVKESPLDYSDFKILNSVLDQTLKTAKKMQKTTEKMIQKLTAGLPSESLL